MLQNWLSAGMFVSILVSFDAVPILSLDSPNASLPTTWVNSITALDSYAFRDGSRVRPILHSGSGFPVTPGYACGFFCNGACDSYLFSIFVIQLDNASNVISNNLGFPQVIWSANRNYPVKENSTLQLTAQGDFCLRDADGVLIWSTNTKGRSVAGLSLTDAGNLVLFDVNNSAVWQSFDHPTDSLVPAQRLKEGITLRASVSSTNWSEGLYSFSVHSNNVIFSINSNPPRVYINESIATLNVTISSNILADNYIKLDGDGRMRHYAWKNGCWAATHNYNGNVKGCHFPLVCGQFGICRRGQCTCPHSKYLKQANSRQPNLGCSEITPVTCNASRSHNLTEIEHVSYFTFNSDIINVDCPSCKKACLANCSCKAAIFRYRSNPSEGECYLLSQVFSFMDRDEDKHNYNISVFLKVQITPDELSHSIAASPRPSPVRTVKSSLTIILGSVGGSLLSLTIGFLILLCKRKSNKLYHDEDDYLNIFSGMPTRFSFEDLSMATDNFGTMLGEGGFGSVFEGSLKDGTKIAVKRLDKICQVEDTFLTEVGSIGSIHHVNLVRLIGFCAEKAYRLLVYEYMANGSLDKWICMKDSEETALDWKYRKKIVLDIAKGLAYLHEDCRQKIIHLDVKPQNILLDENFNAKLSDFGMSKLISRDQSTIVMTVRGTPGYLAPEWLSSKVTEKVDVYSFGVVMMEILCGRRLFDLSISDHEQMHLLSMFNQKAKEGTLLDIIENFSEDMKSNKDEVLKMMHVAAWCLQTAFSSRPSMSLVVKVLEGGLDLDLTHLDFNFLSPLNFAASLPQFCAAAVGTVLFPSVLSGPR